jgi:hypothetical protein
VRRFESSHRRSHMGSESQVKSRSDHSLLSAFELALEQFVDLLRVGFAFGGFHRLAHKEAEHLAALGFVCRTVLLDLLGVGRQHFIQHFSMAPLSVTCLRPRFSMISSALPSPLAMASSTVLAILPEMVLSLMRCNMPPSCSAETGDWSMSRPCLFKQAAQLDHDPVGGQLGVTG